MSAQYFYTQLSSPSHIRIIELHPAQDGDTSPLRCRLVTYDLDYDDQPYEALSYAWGNSIFSHPLIITDTRDASDTDTTMYITSNLSTALHRLRHSNTTIRRIWADAVCINQQNVAEKNIQIPLMSSIYRGAAGVVVWLGSDPAAEADMRLANAVTRRCLTKRKLVAAEKIVETAEALARLLSAPWFSRRWIVQEVVLSQHVTLFCGAESMMWLPFISLLTGLSEDDRVKTMVNKKAVESVLAMFELWKLWALGQPLAGKCQLFQLLETFDHFGCAEAKDRIYAISGLAEQPQENGAVGFSVDVDYSLPTEVLYTRVAEAIVNSGKLLWVLRQASCRRTAPPGACRAKDLPSWVPDWRLPIIRQAFWHNSTTDDLALVERYGPWTHCLAAEMCYITTWKQDPYEFISHDVNISRSNIGSSTAMILRQPSANLVELDVAALEVTQRSPPYSSDLATMSAVQHQSHDLRNWINSVIKEIITWDSSGRMGQMVPLQAEKPEGSLKENIPLIHAIPDSETQNHNIRTEAHVEVVSLLHKGLTQLTKTIQPRTSNWDVSKFYQLDAFIRNVLSTGDTESDFEYLVDDIEKMMSGRRIFASRVRAFPSRFLPPFAVVPPPTLILGIGSSETEIGDRIISFPAAPNGDEIGQLWATQTYLFRETKLETANFGPEIRPGIPDVLSEFVGFELLGDCFLHLPQQISARSDLDSLQPKTWRITKEPLGRNSLHGSVRRRETHSGRMGIFIC